MASVTRRLVAAFVALVAAIAMIVAVGLVVSRGINQSANQKYVDDAIPLKAAVQDLVLQIINQQSSIRGYILTAEESFLTPYEVGRREADRDLAYVRANLDGHPILADLLARAEPQIAALERYFDTQVTRVAQGPSGMTEARNDLDRGKVLSDAFRATASMMLADTDSFVAAAQRAQDRRTRNLTLALTLLGLAAIALAVALAATVPRRARSVLMELEAQRRAATASAARTRRLQSATAELGRQADVAGLAEAVIHQTGASAGALGLLSDDGMRLRLVRVVGGEPYGTADGDDLPATADLPVTETLRSGPLFVADAAELRTRWPALGPAHATGGHEALAAFPLAAEGRRLGAVVLAFAARDPFDEEERGFLSALAGLTAQALERARLYDAQARVADRQTFLADAGAALSGSLDAGAIATELARLAVPGLGDWCAIILTDPAGDRTMASHADDRLEGLATIARGAQGEPATDDADDAAVVCAPLLAGGRELGSICIGTMAGSRAFDADDIAFLRDLGRRAGTAVANALAYERERLIATTLQQGLLPSELPSIPGVESAARYLAAGEGIEVGGDFYDLFAVEPGAGFAATLGDVCGKGPRAAALTALARHTLRSEADHIDPTRVLDRLNATIIRQQPDMQFLTAAYLWFRPEEDGVVGRLASGGHPPALVLRAGGAVEALKPSGDLIGVFPTARFRETPIHLAPGDAIVLYSDGVTEARSVEGEFYGSARLVALVAGLAGCSAEAIAERLGAEVSNFQNGSPRDDIAILVLRATVPELPGARTGA